MSIHILGGFGSVLPEDIKSEDCAAIWGARAIWEGRSSHFDIPPDRQQFDGTAEERKDLWAWTEKVGLPRLATWALRVEGSSGRSLTYREGGYGIRGTPNASYGYMYIRTWKIEQKGTGSADTKAAT